MCFLTNSPKPFHIRALAIQSSNATNFASWDNILTAVQKLGPYFNNGLSVLDLVTMVLGETSDSLWCLRAPVLTSLEVWWWLDILVECSSKFGIGCVIMGNG
jgi:hypothetical protein